MKAIMGEPSFSDGAEWLNYTISSAKVNSVTFRFKNRDTKETVNTVQEINVRLYDNWAVEDAQEMLDAKYELLEEASDCRIYHTTDPQMRIYLYGAPTNQILYINKDPNI